MNEMKDQMIWIGKKQADVVRRIRRVFDKCNTLILSSQARTCRLKNIRNP